jgi:hypothetical protein
MSASESISVDDLFANKDVVAEDIAALYMKWRDAKAPHTERVKEVTQQVYATSTRETSNDALPWSNSTHIPKITQVKDLLEANYLDALMPNEGWFSFYGESADEVSKAKRDKIESYLKAKHRNRRFRQTVSQLLSDWVLTGNCFAQVSYITEKKKNLMTGADEVVYAGPQVDRISPYDIVFNPLAKSFYDSPKIVRTIKAIADIERDILENPSLKYEEAILAEIKSVRNKYHGIKDNTADIAKSTQLEFDGFGNIDQYLESGYVEILEFYGDIYDRNTQTTYLNHVITVVDRSYVIRNQPLNTWTGRPHIYHCGWRKRPDNLWAMGPLDNLVGMQYRINHLENARADAFDDMLDPDIIIEGDVDVVRHGASTHYYIPEAGSGRVAYLHPDTTVLQADFQIQQLENRMELYAGAPREAMGIRTAGEKTAFEVETLTNAAGKFFQHKITQFEEEFLEHLLNAEIEVSRVDMDVADTVKTIDEDGVSLFIEVTRDDLKTNGRLVPMGARHYAERAKLVQTITRLAQSFDQEALLHVSSIDYARALVTASGADVAIPVRPYVRISERAEAAQLQNVAAQQVQEHMMTPATGAEEDFED